MTIANESVSHNLKEKVLQGGLYLFFRQSMGLIISVGGMFLLTRIIGPKNYGIYSSVIAILMYGVSIGGLGINVYLVRNEKNY